MPSPVKNIHPVFPSLPSSPQFYLRYPPCTPSFGVTVNLRTHPLPHLDRDSFVSSPDIAAMLHRRSALRPPQNVVASQSRGALGSCVPFYSIVSLYWPGGYDVDGVFDGTADSNRETASSALLAERFVWHRRPVELLAAQLVNGPKSPSANSCFARHIPDSPS